MHYAENAPNFGPRYAPGMRMGGRRRRLPVLVALLALLALLALAGCVTAGQAGTSAPASASPTDPRTSAAASPDPPKTPLLGAYYYSWFAEYLGLGTLGQHLIPPRGPDASDVSGDPAVAARSIAEASSAGIDFFALDWWPTRPQQDSRIDTGFLKAPNLAAMKFAIFYETGDLGSHIPYSAMTPLTPGVRAHLVADMVGIARSYFANPQYLRIGGRPVVFWYLTRTLTGDVAGAVAEVRTALRALGYDVFLVGDEIFWSVTTPSGGTSTAPQTARAQLFDAITWYNLYDTGNRSSWGYGSQTTFVSDVAALAGRYRQALGGSVPIVPDVMPGYNDRGARPTEGHGAIPRQWAPADSGASFLQHMFDVALPIIDTRAPMVMITTWNEWNEDTGVEPVTSTAATTRDDSPQGSFYTQGYRYGGPATPDLDVIRSVAAARR